MTLTPTPACDPGATLTAAASLLAAAAVLDTVSDAAPVSVTVSQDDISVQVCRHAGEAGRRTAAVAAYARVLRTEVTHRPSPDSPDTWVETHGRVGGHPVHVWTLIHGHEEG